jgi:hypothetical protein
LVLSNGLPELSKSIPPPCWMVYAPPASVGPQPGEAEAVAQRSEQQPVGPARPPAGVQGRDAAPDREIEDLPVQGVGVQHPRVHLGRQLLPYPRRQQQVRRPDLAQIVHHRALILRKADPDAGEQRHRHDVDLFDDPGQRQDRNVLVGRLARIGAQIRRTVLEQRPVLQHRELGV